MKEEKCLKRIIHQFERWQDGKKSVQKLKAAQNTDKLLVPKWSDDNPFQKRMLGFYGLKDYQILYSEALFCFLLFGLILQLLAVKTKFP